MSDLERYRREAARTLGAYCLPGPKMLELLDEIEWLNTERIILINWLNTHYPNIAIEWGRQNDRRKT